MGDKGAYLAQYILRNIAWPLCRDTQGKPVLSAFFGDHLERVEGKVGVLIKVRSKNLMRLIHDENKRLAG
jgi:hypothetical protein